MKTATLPSIRVSPAFRRKAESLLEEGQSLSSLLESVLVEGVEGRLNQKEFVDRALAGADKADRERSWIPARAVLAELAALQKRTRPAKRKSRH